MDLPHYHPRRAAGHLLESTEEDVSMFETLEKDLLAA